MIDTKWLKFGKRSQSKNNDFTFNNVYVLLYRQWFYSYLYKFSHCGIECFQKWVRNKLLHLNMDRTQINMGKDTECGKCIMSVSVLWLTCNRPLYHAEELSELINRHFHLIFSRSHEERRHWETGANCGEIVVRVHWAAVREVGTWNEKDHMT